MPSQTSCLALAATLALLAAHLSAPKAADAQAASVPPARSSPAAGGLGEWHRFSVNGMPVNLLLPDGYSPRRKYPVILYLHQLDMGDWPEGLLKEINPWFNTAQWRKAYPAIVVSPLLNQKADPSGKTINFGGVSPEDQSGEDNAIAAVQQVIKQYSVDPARVYVTGNSLGGIGTWDILIKYNAISGTQGRLFAAGMPLAGAAYDHGYPTPDSSVVSALKDVPIWAIHGAGDTQVPLVWDKALAAALAGSRSFHFTLAPKLAHDVWDTYYALPTGKACWDWLFAQKAVRLSSGTPKAPKSRLLPSGFLSVRGSQIIGPNGAPVRIACVGGFGTVIVGGRLGYSGPYKGLDANLAAIKKTGFNCLRVDFNDKSVDDPVLMAQFDELVAGCARFGLKVIFDHHNNEATAADWGNAAQQSNGLWFDVGPGTDGTDGAHDKGTISSEKFQQDWVMMAKHWAGNSTVIGFDLDNEPHNQYGHNSENWGQGGPCDIWAMYTRVGNAIQAVDPGALIICEGFADITDKSSNLWWTMDLTHVAAKPVVLNVPHRVIYSPHEYPNMRNGGGGPSYVARMNEDWGYLIRRNLAPVWIGEMGASMDAPDEGGHISIADEAGWAKTLLDYMDGVAPGGLRFTKGQQPVSGDWWLWGCRTGESPDGCLNKDGQVRPGQAPYIARMLFLPK